MQKFNTPVAWRFELIFSLMLLSDIRDEYNKTIGYLYTGMEFRNQY